MNYLPWITKGTDSPPPPASNIIEVYMYYTSADHVLVIFGSSGEATDLHVIMVHHPSKINSELTFMHFLGVFIYI